MDLVDKYNSHSSIQRYNELPIRIFLDTNVIQYLCDFGSFIFENDLEENKLKTTRGKIISEGSFLHNQVTCLRKVFADINRSPFHFAISEFIFQEVNRKHDASLTRWISDLWNYWQTMVYESRGNAFQGYGYRRLLRIQSDQSIIKGLSSSDFQVLSDAIELECDAILTCDKYRNRQNWIYDKYGIMILYPSDFAQMIEGFQALWS